MLAALCAAGILVRLSKKLLDFYDSLQQCRYFCASRRRKSPRVARRKPCMATLPGHSIPREAGRRPLALPRPSSGGYFFIIAFCVLKRDARRTMCGGHLAFDLEERGIEEGEMKNSLYIETRKTVLSLVRHNSPRRYRWCSFAVIIRYHRGGGNCWTVFK